MYAEPLFRAELRVSDLPRALPPREKLIQAGAKTLSHVELLAVILGAGTRKHDVLKIAERLIRKHGLGALPGLSVQEWIQNAGVGQARACRLVALFELARRLEMAASREPARISGPSEVYAHTRDLADLKKEHLVGLYLDSQNHLIARETLSVGSLNTTRTHPREILHPAIIHLALGFILVHNHPLCQAWHKGCKGYSLPSTDRYMLGS